MELRDMVNKLEQAKELIEQVKSKLDEPTLPNFSFSVEDDLSDAVESIEDAINKIQIEEA